MRTVSIENQDNDSSTNMVLHGQINSWDKLQREIIINFEKHHKGFDKPKTVLTTGGTIAGENKNGITRPKYKGFDLLKKYRIEPDFAGIRNCSDSLLIDSTEFQLHKHGNKLLNSIYKIYSSGCNRILVTCGTDQLDLIASTIERFGPIDCKIVITGSMREANSIESTGNYPDGESNLKLAIEALEELKYPSTLVAFGTRLFPAYATIKINARDPEGITCKPEHLLWEPQMDGYCSISEALDQSQLPQRFGLGKNEKYPYEVLKVENSHKWSYIKTYPIDPAENPINLQISASIHDAIILLSLGDCNIPVENKNLKKIIETIAKQKPVVNVSRVPFSQAEECNYMGGQAYPDIFPAHFSLAATQIRLQHLLAYTNYYDLLDIKQMKQLWLNGIPGDVFSPNDKRNNILKEAKVDITLSDSVFVDSK